MGDLKSDAREELAMQEFYNEIGPAWVQDHAEELYEVHYDLVTRDFTQARLKSYYLLHPDVAVPAARAVEYAKSIPPQFATAGFVFAATSVELTWKACIARPLVSGIVLFEALAQSIVEKAVPKYTGPPGLGALLSAVLRETAAIDLTTYKITGSRLLLRDEINDISGKRNEALHQGKAFDWHAAAFAIEVADRLLQEFLPKLLSTIGLSVDRAFIIHEARL